MSRMLKKPASIVLASLRGSTYRKGTPRLFARCGLADGLFEHPAMVSLLEGRWFSEGLSGWIPGGLVQSWAEPGSWA